ncbi:S8 family peptidase [Sinomicrobium weinanense]|uniref:S8 family serine peptidase n=1 Tax=Sinomicrobium weinanense TaxID=2842200 RepID=A0A926JNY5_9FLAO|nr:S8 family serine peptidase [Sinomicrobium weinanense]MBC9794788.1 S8 family serine peptidase [Sinomicrobium weinanense]MBU3125047.1 S8 family serine peptidase [Sinomicrobium weinanense]
MKPHLLIKLNDSSSIPQYEYWEDLIHDKQDLKKDFLPEIDRIIRHKYHLDFFPAQNYASKYREWTMDEINSGLNRIYRLILLTNNPDIPEQLVKDISLLPSVSYVKPGRVMASHIPEKELAGAQSLSSKYVDNSIYLKESHLITRGSKDVIIAVLDTGIETNHPELRNKFTPGKDLVNIIDEEKKFIGDFLDMDDIPDDNVGHGTHVAGILISRGIKMPIGVAPACRIMPIKVLGALKNGDKLVGAGLVDDIDAGIKYAVDHGADIINMSLGIKHSGGGLPHEDIINYVLKKNVFVVAASGNDGRNDKYYPGALDGVFAVGASDNTGNIAPFSTYGGHVSVSAPGINVYSTYLDDGYALSSGTSQAAPYVSGTVALLKSYALEKGKKADNDLISYVLKNTCDKFSTQYKDQKSGYGRINVLDALKLLRYNL